MPIKSKRVTDKFPALTGWQAFAKYVGIQGLLALILITGYVIASLTGAVLSDTYTNITFAVTGYYFAKNGVGIIDALKGKSNV